MNPEESQRLSACLQEVAAILYRNTPPEELTTFESLEKAVRTQLLGEIGPQIAFFLSSQLQPQTKVEGERSIVALVK